MARSIMVVEDDPAIRMVLNAHLRDEGHLVIECPTAEHALVQLVDGRPDVILVDLRLPGINGLDLVRSVRARSEVPIIIVTAQTDSHDVVAGMEAGADDYVTKPFVAKELMARIRRQLRRGEPRSAAAPILQCGPLELRPATGQALLASQPLTLSRIEFDVLAELMSAGGRVLSRDELLRDVWGYDSMGDGRIVDSLIYRLRGKIETDAANPQLLLTVRGFGYRMDARE
ncbi:MAG TPA: DNA-binding response regulator [Actinobacteria bacterium]|nr:DNA-binding response regulator [Actinomycetota bacterium]